jgi:hypothetical protein
LGDVAPRLQRPRLHRVAAPRGRQACLRLMHGLGGQANGGLASARARRP